jgi:tight adherence protein C
MLGIWTLFVFVLVAAGTSLIVWRIWDWRIRAVDRITPRHGGFLPSPSLAWRELVDRVGSFVPASPKDLPRLKRRLVRAGLRNPAAARFFNGARVVLAILLSGIGLLLGVHSGALPNNILLLGGVGAALGYLAPSQYLSLRIKRRQRAIEKGLPNALDLMVVCVEAGLGLDQTVVQVAKELQFAYPDICDELAVVNLEMRAGKRRAEALHNLAERTGVEELRKLVAVLVQTDRFGTSISQSLRGHSDYMRVMARQRAEERAAKLAVKLVFPIFFCVLPSLFVVTVGPVLTRLVRDLLPAIQNM